MTFLRKDTESGITFMPVCSKCESCDIFISINGCKIRLDKCPNCGHKIKWNAYNDMLKKLALGGQKK